MPNRLEPSLTALVETIEQLTPAQRRQLLKRLRVSGLLPPESAITDQQRLRVAPALGPNYAAHHATAKEPRPLNTAATPVSPSSDPAGAQVYRSPVSGKVVMGAPSRAAAIDDPHAMSPLPGQAPEQPIVIVFDGGSKGNPGQGYGSYLLDWPGAQPQLVKLRFGDRVTNNEAEYDTLIAALEAVLQRLRDNGAAPAGATLDIRGDSLLVVNQVLGKWQCSEERLQMRRDQVCRLLQLFSTWRLTHHARANSVRLLGH